MTIPVTPGFSFNGSTSDLAQQYLKLHWAGETVPSVPINMSQLPPTLGERLRNAGSANYTALPGLLQRALLWDAGYLFQGDILQEVHTLGGRSMAEIAVSHDEFERVGCTKSTCLGIDRVERFRSYTCTSRQLRRVAKCITSSTKAPMRREQELAWPTRGNPVAIPDSQLRQLKFDSGDSDTDNAHLAFGIFTSAETLEAPQCIPSSTSATAGALVIPCLHWDADKDLLPSFSPPKHSALVAAWLRDPMAPAPMPTAEPDSGGSNSHVDDAPISSPPADDIKSGGGGESNKTLVVVLPIVLVVLFLVAGAVALWYRRKRRQPQQEHHVKTTDPSTEPTTAYTAHSSVPNTANLFATGNGVTEQWTDTTILAARVPLEKVRLGEMISRGGYGEVYRGSYQDRPVAIKKLLPERRKDLHQIDAFFAEVRMMASLDHEHIVQFVGVAWDSLNDLCVLSEFMDGGDLRTLLQRFEQEEHRPHGFDADKVRIALHVAHALTYLHSMQPVVLHRDLKSKNILLDRDLNAKLTDFGVSRERIDATMTAGVGSSLWMAPEVMMGERYDEKADVFSFGVVLSELDMHATPYSHAREPGTKRKLPETALLQMVAMGKLQVGFSYAIDGEANQGGNRWNSLGQHSVDVGEDVSETMTRIGRSCVAVQPGDRPTAPEVLHAIHCVWRNCAAL